MKSGDIINICYTKDINLASFLIAANWTIHEKLGIVRDEKGTATFYFEPINPITKQNAHSLIADWANGDKGFDDPTLQLIWDTFINRKELLDYLKKEKPAITVTHGKYNIIMPGNITTEEKQKLIDTVTGGNV